MLPALRSDLLAVCVRTWDDGVSSSLNLSLCSPLMTKCARSSTEQCVGFVERFIMCVIRHLIVIGVLRGFGRTPPPYQIEHPASG